MKDRSVELLPQPLLDKVAAVATVRAFAKRSIIVSEGDDTDSLYVVLSGKARVFVADDKGREVQLNQLGAPSGAGLRVTARRVAASETVTA